MKWIFACVLISIFFLTTCFLLPKKESLDVIRIVSKRIEGDIRQVLVVEKEVFVARLFLSGGQFSSAVIPLITLPYLQEDGAQIGFWVRPQASNGNTPFMLEVPQGVGIHGYEAYGSDGSLIASLGEISDVLQERAIIPAVLLRNAGDLCLSTTMISGQDGWVNVWDLIYLLNRYNTTDTSADIGRMGDQVVMPPIGPFQADVHPDGVVDVWDLILLLNGYGASFQTINTPFAPLIDSVTASGVPGSYTAFWHNQFQNDVYEEYRLYALDSLSAFSTTTAQLLTIPKAVSQTSFSTTKPYIALCSVNKALGQPYTFFSSPTFYTLPSPTQSQLSFETTSYSVPAGSMITVRVLATGLSLFQSVEVLLGYTGNQQLFGVSAGAVFNTNSRLMSGQKPSQEFFAHATHLYGQNSVLSSGVLLTYSILANTSGTVFFKRAQWVDASLNSVLLQTAPGISIQVY